jgi:hypothetical protein
MDKRDFDYGNTKKAMKVTSSGDMLRCVQCGQRWSPGIVGRGEEFYVGAIVSMMICPNGCNTPEGYEETLQAAEEKWLRETYPYFLESLEELKKDPAYEVMEEAEEFEVWIDEHKDERREFVANELCAWLEENVAAIRE